jgi:hypothetical protein
MIRLLDLILEIIWESDVPDEVKRLASKEQGGHVAWGHYFRADGYRWDRNLNDWVPPNEDGKDGDSSKVMPYQSGEDSSSTPDQQVPRMIRSKAEIASLVFGIRDGKYVDPLERINDPENTTYGPPPSDATDISSDLMNGAYATAPIIGAAADIEVPYITGTKFVNFDILDKTAPSDIGRLDAVYSDMADSIHQKYTSYIETSDADSKEQLEDIFENLQGWQGEDFDSKSAFIDKVGDVFPTKIETGGPLVRGLKINKGLFDEFMKDFEVGTKIMFPNSYGFTTDSKLAKFFCGVEDSKGKPTSAIVPTYPVIMRLHPADDGQISAVGLTGIQSVQREVSNRFEEESDGVEFGSIRHLRTSDVVRRLRSLSSFYSDEREHLIIPSTVYEVVGRVRLITPDQKKMGMIIDIREKSSQTTEQRLPGSPTLPKPKANSVNKVVQYYMNQPLNPNK